jgi:methionyl-tRNA formyltransferase
MSDFSIVFMGTPEFAVEILRRLHSDFVDIKAVVTAPDKPSGRGQKMNQSAVKKFAIEKGLTVLQPTNLKDPDFVQALGALNADLFVVVAFRMLPEVIWEMPPKGTINLHASLLPNYRGAAPINWAIINGETRTGVTAFFIEKEIDTGDITKQEIVAIGENESVGELYARLMAHGADVISTTVETIKQGHSVRVKQSDLYDPAIHKPAPKIFKSDCRIDFNRPVKEVHDFCRGLSPYPAAWCTLYNKDKNETKTYKIFGTLKTDVQPTDSTQISSNSEGLLFPCSDSYLLVTEIQPEGKRKMTHKEFLAGNSVENLTITAL